MKTLAISRGLTAYVDDEDYDSVNRFKWTAARGRKTWYAHRGERQRKIMLHRMVLNVTDPSQQVDHKNGNGLDCQKENLRLATHAQNIYNQGMSRNNSSGFKGVYWSEHNGHWRAQIGVNRKLISLGGFDTAEEAGLAYDAAAKRFYGEFAWLNFPNEELKT